MIEIVKMLRDRVCTNPCPTMTFESQCDCALDVFAANLIEELEAKTKHTDSKRIEELEQALRTIAQHDTQTIALDALYPGDHHHNRLRKK